ncbi:MAG TPA: glycosyltransferase [Ignavibacteriaceae bacterium]|nr:glycosyltransferase [Ignavibacteriaceae bacterium]
MIKKVALVTTGHPPLDERIFWKFAISISSNGYDTVIFCSTENISIKKENVFIKGFSDDTLSRKEKLNRLFSLIREFKPDLIICPEVSAIIPAYKYKKTDNNKCKIVSDVTEWYPENVAFKKSGILKILNYLSLFAGNIFLTNKCDSIISGEKSKLNRYKIISPFKRKIIIRYYPVIKYFRYSPTPIKDELILCYAGLINFSRGIIELLHVAEKLADAHPGLQIKLRLVGKFQSKNEENEFNNIIRNKKSIQIELREWTEYKNISENLADVHICFDLRKRNYIYNNSLPIKIFEYMACGKPFIFTDVKPIRDEMKADNFGFLADPDNKDEIVKLIEKYLNDKTLYLEHSKNGRMEIERNKNWETESQKLLSLISGL